ncbi:MAG: GNAT family N-acetyltransferase [Desulfobacteraceae bacterium]|nr:GNAT family N-acetyltransferase [Desulfobacteraceae bacterium]
MSIGDFRIRTCTDPDECGMIWRALWPRQCLFDLWEVRECFSLSFNRPPVFLTAERNGAAAGMLALSWIDEKQYFGHFPGEIWQGKTWLEQNKIPAAGPGAAQALLDAVPGVTFLRYLTRESLPDGGGPAVPDETGYLFFPPEHEYSFDNYFKTFPGKSRKQLGRERARLEALGIEYRFNHFPDVPKLFELNHNVFGEKSYFHDPRFLGGFERLASRLDGRSALRVTTVLLGGRVAAVDIGGVWNSTYTVLAGGTDPEFPGVAKLINFQHLKWACESRMQTVDFLCGDFGWKERFHLTPRPLYKIHLPHPAGENGSKARTANG